ncbi:MAG: methyltransferase domain-containing protein, partial [archaeon]|nr:methyltransferase domain-containing protein [archaeon]
MASFPPNTPKDPVYWDYWHEMVKASIRRDTHELPAILEEANIVGKHVIDAGYDPGRLVVPFSKLAASITCVRESDWSVTAIQKLVREHGLRDKVQVVKSPSVGLPLDDEVSDATYCVWVIHYAKSRWEKIVKELVRITKKGCPIVIGFTSGERDLPHLEGFTKPDNVLKTKAFDQTFPAFCEEQGWKVSVRKLVLPFQFKSPEWALEVFSNTFMRREEAV